MDQIEHYESSRKIPDPPTYDGLDVYVEWQLEVGSLPHIVQRAGGEDDLPSAGPYYALMGFAHQAKEQISRLISRCEHSNALRAHVMVEKLVSWFTTEFTEIITILVFIPGFSHFHLPNNGVVVHRPGPGMLGPLRLGLTALLVLLDLMAVRELVSLSGIGIEPVTEVRSMMRLTDWLTLSCT